MSSQDRFSLEALPHMDSLRRFAFKLCRNEQLSRDLVQETMLRAYRSFTMYREGTNCRAWLFQICKNVYINFYRRKQIEPLSVDMLRESPEVFGGETLEYGRGTPVSLRDDTEPGKQKAILGDEVIRALEQLPREYQTAIILSDIEGQTYEEIADFMQAPIGTIRSRIHRGRKMLAGSLAGYARRTGWQELAEAA
jgi:RNA polymerase sigma-70 factor (ECF subfamily)